MTWARDLANLNEEWENMTNKWKANQNKWSAWERSGNGFQKKHMFDGEWSHELIALFDEPSPNQNHIHVKKRGKDHVLCSMKVDGIREVNRGRLINYVNGVTGLNLNYRGNY